MSSRCECTGRSLSSRGAYVYTHGLPGEHAAEVWGQNMLTQALGLLALVHPDRHPLAALVGALMGIVLVLCVALFLNRQHD